MKKKQKDNLIKAFEELNAPDKDVLLQKIESKKALGGDFAQSKGKTNQKAIRRVAWASLACSVLVIALVLIIISSSVFGANNNAPNGSNDGSNIGADVIDYRSSWKFKADENISFGEFDKTIKDAGVELIYDYNDEWTIVETQITQDESAYREYYVKDGVTVEVTLLLEEKYTSMDGRYYSILQGRNYSFVSGKYNVYCSSYSVNGVYKFAYAIFLKDQVYIFTSDKNLKYMFE
ncbi:MAG: hypothetical protein K2I23_00890 [Clostridia bacterium]|nr:hypothetical protein [Clostridia bacterium]